MKKLASKNILVVDDEEYLREVLSDWLTIEGAVVSTAEGATQALEKFKAQSKTQSFDVIITDYRMPGKSGGWLVEQIKSQAGTQPKIFVCSGFSDLSSEDLTKLNVTGIFGKPFDENKIIEALATALSLS